MNALGPIVNILEPMYEAIEDKTTKDAKDLKTMIDNGIELIVKMWKRFHNYVIMSKAAPVLTGFLTEQAVGFEPEQLTTIGDTWLWPSKIKPKVA